MNWTIISTMSRNMGGGPEPIKADVLYKPMQQPPRQADHQRHNPQDPQQHPKLECPLEQ